MGRGGESMTPAGDAVARGGGGSFSCMLCHGRGAGAREGRAQGGGGPGRFWSWAEKGGARPAKVKIDFFFVFFFEEQQHIYIF
jgi:hypothetical protein